MARALSRARFWRGVGARDGSAQRSGANRPSRQLAEDRSRNCPPGAFGGGYRRRADTAVPDRIASEKASAIVGARHVKAGLFDVQDEGSQIAALMAGARPGMRIVDFCAGAGGKTLALAAGMANRGKLVACDVSDYRLERAAQRLRRAS